MKLRFKYGLKMLFRNPVRIAASFLAAIIAFGIASHLALRVCAYSCKRILRSLGIKKCILSTAGLNTVRIRIWDLYGDEICQIA